MGFFVRVVLLATLTRPALTTTHPPTRTCVSSLTPLNADRCLQTRCSVGARSVGAHSSSAYVDLCGHSFCTRHCTLHPLLCQGARRLVQWRANFGSSGILSCVCVAHADGVCAIGPPPTLTHHLHTCLLRQVFAVLTLRHCRLQLPVDRKAPCILSKVSSVRSSPYADRTHTRTHRCYVRELVASCNGVANFGSSGILSCVCVAHAGGACAIGSHLR